MADVLRPSISSLRLRESMRWEYRVLFILAFAWFLLVAAVTRVLPRAWRPHLPGVEPNRSIFGEAWAVAGTLVPFAFMR